MIYDIKQFALARGETLKAKSLQSTTKFVNLDSTRVGKKHISAKRIFSIQQTTGSMPNSFIELFKCSDLKQFETYIQYVCGLYKVKEIYWRVQPCMCGNWAWAIGSFVIDGDFDHSQYNEITRKLNGK